MAKGFAIVILSLIDDEESIAEQSGALQHTARLCYNVHGEPAKTEQELKVASEKQELCLMRQYTTKNISLANVIEIDPEKLGGMPVFYGTRVPIQNLFECLESGESLDQFLDQFPTVTREQAIKVLEASKERLLTEYARAA